MGRPRRSLAQRSVAAKELSVQPKAPKETSIKKDRRQPLPTQTRRSSPTRSETACAGPCRSNGCWLAPFPPQPARPPWQTTASPCLLPLWIGCPGLKYAFSSKKQAPANRSAPSRHFSLTCWPERTGPPGTGRCAPPVAARRRDAGGLRSAAGRRSTPCACCKNCETDRPAPSGRK